MIQVEGLYKSFGAQAVLKGVDLTIPQGESHAIIGGSGHGKTVLIKCILGLLKPDAGRCTPLDMSKVGVLFQGGALFDGLSVWENIAFQARQRGMGPRQAQDLAAEKLAQVGLQSDALRLMPAALSGGMQKRVALARAIADDPNVLVFDEPTTGLDPVRAGQINTLLRNVIAETGATAITITHDMTSAEYLADHVAFLHDGRIEWRGAASMLRSSGNGLLEDFIMGRAPTE